MTPLSRPQPVSAVSALQFVNAFRALLLIVLLLMSLLSGENGPLLDSGPRFYQWTAAYGLLVLLWQVLRNGRLAHTLQLTLAIVADIAMIVLLLALNQGVHSGYGILLLPYLAVAGLLSSGRYALFYASLATLALLGYVGAEQWLGSGHSGDWLQAALLSMAGFVTSVVTWQLARVARASEELATQRGGEIANLNRLNELILQSQRDAVVVLGDSGEVQQFNHQAERHFPALARSQRRSELMPLLERWQQNGCPTLSSFIECNARGRRLVGRMAPVQEGNMRVLVLFLRDMADMAEEAKRIKLAALGRLTANIAHEIRNPLSAISHAADLMAEDEADPAQARLTRIVQNNAQRINALVEEVLMLGRRDRVRSESIELAPFIADILEQFALVQPDSAGAIACRLAEGSVVEFDRVHLRQVLNNLLANGWRHSSHRPGAVCIATECLQTRLALRVSDDGAGVSEEDQAHLFEPFFTTESSGTGLGLYIARELAEANDARLDYQGPGGVFRLSCHRANPTS